MKISDYFIFTYKNIICDIKFISNKFLLQSGFMNQLSTGVYIFFPICLKVIKNICKIIKTGIEKLGFLEIHMPVIQPIDLFKFSKRLTNFNLELFSITDRKNLNFILSPTNEEIILFILKNKIKNFKCLPLKFYQIGTKFRDELRSGFGLIRCKEFLMKDGYSFFINNFDLKRDYENIYILYVNIFNKLNINYKIILARNDIMGGYYSHEFYLIFNDAIFYNNLFKYSNCINLLKVFYKNKIIFYKDLNILFTPNISDFFIFSNYFKLNIKHFIKVAIIISNNIINKIILKIFYLKSSCLEKFVLKNFILTARFINFREINLFYNLNFNYLGITNVNKIITRIYTDSKLSQLNRFITSFNRKNYLFNVVCIKNCKEFKNSKSKNPYKFKNYNIEIAHIFQLGDFYSKKFNFKIKNKYNNYNYLLMGCYGIGISRLISCIIEYNYDKKGMIWPDNISPFKIVICPLGYNYINIVRIFSDKIYSYLKYFNIDIIIDDRTERLGVMLNDWDLIGIPYKIIITENNIKKNKVEYIYRKYFTSNLINYKNFKNQFIKKFKFY